MHVKKIAITLGEPAGIGPDVIAQIAQQTWPAALVVIGDPDVLQARAQQLSLPLRLRPYAPQQSLSTLPAGELYCHPVPVSVPVQAGQLAVENAASIVAGLRYAGEGCLHHEFDAVATAPVHKGIINEAGIPFSGHTEFFAQLASVPRVVMLLMTPTLKVALVTTHLPLRQVADAITPARLTETIHIINTSLKNHFGIAQPRIAVCGLNPHAGEGGHLGLEEIEVIEPVLTQLRAQGMSLIGPLSADTIFMTPADIVLAMYHDQGLPVIKYSGFQQAVNVTLGLPFIRTSVDHGTALSLAGTGHADAGSMLAATQLAINLSNNNESRK